MSKIVPFTRAWFREAFHRSVDATLTRGEVSIPLEPEATRRGIDEQDRRTPFYEMNPSRLWGYYYGYKRDERRYGPYADLLAFQTEELKSIWRDSVRTDAVRVELDPSPYCLSPDLKAHSHVAVDLFKTLGKINQDKDTKEWENNLSIRLKKRNDGVFHCQPVRYFEQVATNLTVDWASGELPKADTIRLGMERPRDGLLPPIEQSLLANSFGTAIMFYDRELTRMLIRLRSDNLASIAQKALHCTVSGVLEMPPASEHGFDFFMYGTRHEIKMETNLDPDQYLLFPIGMARELARAGKPQLFFMAISLVDDKTFERECKNAIERNEYVIVDKEGEFFSGFEEPTSELQDAYTYEGWASQLMAEDFLDINEEAIKKKLARL